MNIPTTLLWLWNLRTYYWFDTHLYVIGISKLFVVLHRASLLYVYRLNYFVNFRCKFNRII